MTVQSTLILDLDGTLTQDIDGVDYAHQPARDDVVASVLAAKDFGLALQVVTARGMRSRKGDIGRIQQEVQPEIEAWLVRHGLPIQNLTVGKPWAGPKGYYVDDRALHPEECVFRFNGPYAKTPVALSPLTLQEASIQARRLFDLVAKDQQADWSLHVTPEHTWALRPFLAMLLAEPPPLACPLLGYVQGQLAIELSTSLPTPPARIWTCSSWHNSDRS